MLPEPSQEQAPGLSLGDWIECDFTVPTPHTRGARLNTPDAMMLGLELLSDPDSGWRRATRDWSAQQAAQEAAKVA